MAKQLEKLTSQEVDFAKWYTDIVKNANLMEYGPVKGSIIFKPYGYAIWENIQRILDKEFKKQGVENVYFPLLIPESLFNKEKNHIEGFAPEVVTVTRVGDKELAEPLFIRPTSEVLFADYFKNNVHSYRDLPLIFNQWVSVMRWEKTTRPFLRTTEFLWQEGHTVHASATEANDFAKTILGVYENFAKNSLLLPVISGTKSEMERFAGAEQTYTIESLMHDGQALQTGTSHYLGTNFTKTYEITFQDQDSKLINPFSTSWGVSTRMIGAIIMSHGDNQGLVLPSAIAPDQIRIIPVKDDEKVLSVVEQLKNELVDNYRVKVDLTNKTFGYKISEAEIQGVPLRIEVGPRDLETGVVTISRRDNLTKTTVKLEEVKTFIAEQLKIYDQEIYNKALKNREQRTYQTDNFAEYEKIINSTPGFVLAPFCGRVECETKIKAETATVSRCFPFDQQESELKCFHCGSPAKFKAYFGRAY